MARARWIVPWKDSSVKPVFYHCISRVVDRRLAFGADEKEKFRVFMRMQENFTGCRVVSYCLMCNHIHLLLEVPPMPEDGLSDDVLLLRLRAIYSEAFVADVARELADARQKAGEGLAEESVVVGRIHQRFTYRMHDLSEFMKTLMQRFTQWFNRTHRRSGNLWEDAFKSVIVEDGVAAKTMAAYIDLNPVRAGMVEDPADYRWSSYGEAIGGGARGGGRRARAGLVRALRGHKGTGADPALWADDVSREYRMTLMAGGMAAPEDVERNAAAGAVPLGKMLRCRVRYFSDGAVIGSRSFVNQAFSSARQRFGPNRKTGARKLKGSASAASGVLWSLRDLKRGI